MDVGILMPFASDGWPAIRDSQVYGTPDQILATLEARRELIGPFEYTTAFRYGGIPDEEARASMQLFGSEVLPVLATWD